MTPSWPVMAGCSSPRRRPPATRCRTSWQVRAISVMPSPVSTSDSVMSSDPQSGQTWAWKRTRKSFTAAHPCRGCRRRISRARSARVAGVGGDPGLGAALVAGHVLDRGPAQPPGSPHSTQGASGPMVPCRQSRTTRAGMPLVAWDMPKVSFAFAGRGWFWLAGPGDGRPPGPALLCQVVMSQAARRATTAAAGSVPLTRARL